MADVIPHASTTSASTAFRHGSRPPPRRSWSAIASVVAAEWTWWLHPHGALAGRRVTRRGRPARRAPPARAPTLARAGRRERNRRGPRRGASRRRRRGCDRSDGGDRRRRGRHRGAAPLVRSRHVPVAAGARARHARSPRPRWAAWSVPRSTRWRVPSRSTSTAPRCGVARGRRPCRSQSAWCWSRRRSSPRSSSVAPARRRGGPLEAVVLATAVVTVSVLVLGRWDDPLAFSAAALLVWAALRFGARGGRVVGHRDGRGRRLGRRARAAGPFDTMLSGARRVDPPAGVRRGHAPSRCSGSRSRSTNATPPSWREPTPPSGSGARSTTPPSPWPSPRSTGGSWRPTGPCARCWPWPTTALVGTSLLDPAGPTTAASTTSHVTRRPSETRLVNSRGDTVWVEISESPLRRLDERDELQVVVLRDVTERKVLQQQLFHAQKMESVGRLAGGIAHDFNNVLAVMRGQVELLQDDLEVLESARARIDSVQRATDRAAALTDDLMAFSRRRVDEPEPFDLHELLLGVRELLHQVLGDRRHPRARARGDRGHDRGRPQPPRAGGPQPRGQRARRDAGGWAGHHHDPQRSRGPRRHWCCASPTPVRAWTPPPARASSNRSSPPSRRGSGPASACRPPTTSCGPRAAPSRSTAAAATAPRSRSRSRCLRPTRAAAIRRSDSMPPVVTSTRVLPRCSSSTTSPTCASLVAEILQGSGYRVLAAPDGDAAIALLERAHRPVDLLVTDVVMPVMSGTDLAARITDRSPSTRVLFVSGFRARGLAVAARRPARRQAAPARRAPRRGAHRARRRRLTLPDDRVRERSGSRRRGR